MKKKTSRTVALKKKKGQCSCGKCSECKGRKEFNQEDESSREYYHRHGHL